jgi:hypothetical protein
MSIVNLPAMLASLLVYGAIFVAVERRQLDTTYGDARHGIWAALVRTALLQLRRLAFHPSNWRPNLVILGGNPDKRRYLLELGSAIVQQRGMVTYFHLLTGTVRQRARDRARLLDELGRAITTAFPTVFYRVDIVPDLYTGAVQVVQTYGLGTFEATPSCSAGRPRPATRRVTSGCSRTCSCSTAPCSWCGTTRPAASGGAARSTCGGAGCDRTGP